MLHLSEVVHTHDSALQLPCTGSGMWLQCIPIFLCYTEIQSGVTDACWGSALFLACGALGLHQWLEGTASLPAWWNCPRMKGMTDMTVVAAVLNLAQMV